MYTLFLLWIEVFHDTIDVFKCSLLHKKIKDKEITMLSKIGDLLFSLLLCSFLPLGIVGLFDTELFLNIFDKIISSTNWMGVTPTPHWWNRIIFKLMSITSILIGMMGILFLIKSLIAF